MLHNEVQNVSNVKCYDSQIKIDWLIDRSIVLFFPTRGAEISEKNGYINKASIKDVLDVDG